MSEATSAPPTIAGTPANTVHLPGSIDDLRAILRTTDGTTFVPMGGATMLERGRPPHNPYDILDLSHALRGEIQHQADDLTVIVPAGMTIDEVNVQLAPSGQWIPLDPPHPELATIGGTVALGMNGPLRGRYGLVRDLVLGMTVLRADGELVKAGGRVVKNVTGYDLMRLWCGSHGTLGIVTEVALRALPRVSSITLSAEYTTLQQIADTARTMSTNDLRPEFADAFKTTDGWRFVVRVVESAQAAAMAALHNPAAIEDDGLYVRSRDIGTNADNALVVSASTTFGRIADLATSVAALGPDECVVRPLAGVVRASWIAASVRPIADVASAIGTLRAMVSDVQGSVTIDRMPAAYHQQIDAWDEPPGSFAIMQKVKSAYDPEGRLNRGRFIGGI